MSSRVRYGLLVVVLVDIVIFTAVGLGGALRRHKEIVALESPTPHVALPSIISTLPSPSGEASPSPAVRACDRPTLIGTVSVDRVMARAKPDPNASVIATFDKRNQLGTPQVLDLVEEGSQAGGGWYKALLPIRPNGTTGYLPAKALDVTSTTYRLRLDRAKFALALFDGCQKLRTFTVGIGTGDTPTPVGRFYLTGLFKPPVPNTIYGVSIYTLSGFSEVLTNWKLGGIIGLHGTNDPGSIGRNFSHGCIRMLNRDILRLEKILPLGTPIVIH